MLAWKDQPIEVANLFNPAFCSVLLHGAVGTYQSKRDEGIPYSLSFLVLPLVLHKKTRAILPRTARTKFHVWLQNNPSVEIGFSKRAQNLVPITKDAIIFGANKRVLMLGHRGELMLGNTRLKKTHWDRSHEPADCYRAARLIGNWFAQSGSPSTILTMLGIQP